MPISPLPLHLTITTFLLLILQLILQTKASIRIIIGTCHSTGFISTKSSSCPSSNCCLAGQNYSQYSCSPPVSPATSAILYKTSFSNSPSKCDNKTYSDSDLVVTLSTGWYKGGARCLKNITIVGNENSVSVRVVGECDSVSGCVESNGNEPPCGYDWIVGSPAVWSQLGVPQSQSYELDVTWSDTT